MGKMRIPAYAQSVPAAFLVVCSRIALFAVLFAVIIAFFVMAQIVSEEMRAERISKDFARILDELDHFAFVSFPKVWTLWPHAISSKSNATIT